MTDRHRVLALLRRHGWNATSFQALEPDFRYWFDGDDAAVAYFETRGAWVVAGPPIADDERLATVARRFAEAAREHGRRVVFFGVERRFLSTIDMHAVVIGEQPRWDPRAWEERHRGHRGLKEQLRRARAKGVVVERVAAPPHEEMQRIITRWQCSRTMPPMAFLVELSPFAFEEERRYYVARANGAMQGFLVAVPVYQRDGWFFEDILRDPRAPNGTTESLVHAAMLDVAASGASFVTLGLAPLAGDAQWLRVARTLMQGFYNFAGLRAFKAKLRPEAWDPVYVAWPDGNGALVAIYDVLDAFAGGRLASFGMRAALRAPAPVLLTLGVLLVPWTMFIALAPTRKWFPSRAIQNAWTVFDAIMCGVLLSLARRWKPRLAIAAAAAATADAVLTSVEVATYNARRARRVKDWLIMAAAVVAPAAAAGILIGGIRSRRSRSA